MFSAAAGVAAAVVEGRREDGGAGSSRHLGDAATPALAALRARPSRGRRWPAAGEGPRGAVPRGGEG